MGEKMDDLKNKVEAIYKWGNWDGQLKLKIYSAPFVIKVMPVKTTMGYHIIIFKLAKI